MTASYPAGPEKEAAVQRGGDLMLDPSSLLDRAALSELLDLAGEIRQASDVFLPASFLRALSEPHLVPTVSRFYGYRQDEVGASDIPRLVQTAGVRTYPEARMVLRGEDAVAMRLMSRRGVMRDILLEEWMFLVGQSWIVGRSSKTFDAFKRAGAVVVEFGGRNFDRLVAHTLHHNRLPVPPPLTHRERLRAAAKWVAIGGSSAAGLLDPILAFAAGSGAGAFLLLDP